MRSRQAAAAALVSILVGGCASVGGIPASKTPAGRPTSSTVSTASLPGPRGATRCRAEALVLRPGGYVSPATGEHALMFALANRGAVTCTVEGYPRVVLYGRQGIPLPFRYTKGGGQYVTRSRPVTVILAPGASAYVLVAKYRCDIGTAATAAAIQVTLAAAHGVRFSAREAVHVGPGTPDLSYCRGGPLDPGQAVAVSPVEPSRQAATSF
jgi:Protein of unknown function (DUF4232)